MDNVQGTQAWHELRCGKITASRINDIMATGKSGEAASRVNYRAELVAERLTGKQEEGFKSGPMQWGNDCEPFAIAAYEARKGLFVERVAFVCHPKIANAGASPDALVDIDGLLEIKCPNTATHIANLTGANIKREYLLQMQWQMACTGRLWCDFMSFDPRLPDDLQTKIVRVERDNALIAQIEAEVLQFDAEVTALVNKLNNLKEAA